MTERRLERRRRGEHSVEIDARRDAEPGEEIEKIFRCEIAGRAGRVRASAEAARGRVEGGDSEVERSEHVGERSTSRVVKMKGDPLAADLRRECGEHAPDLTRMSDADRVA